MIDFQFLRVLHTALHHRPTVARLQGVSLVMVKPFGENPGHLEVGYEPRAPSAGKATAGEASKAVPFNREMWIERRLFMRDEFLHSARQGLVHKDAAASDKLNMGCQSTALLRTSNPHNFFPDSVSASPRGP